MFHVNSNNLSHRAEMYNPLRESKYMIVWLLLENEFRLIAFSVSNEWEWKTEDAVNEDIIDVDLGFIFVRHKVEGYLTI
jgi:hypothetical protein